MEPSLSPIPPVCADDSESVDLPEVGLLVSPLLDVRSDIAADVSWPVSPLPSVESLLLQDICCGHQLLLSLLTSTIVTRPQCLGGGWLGRVRSLWSDRLSPSVHWGLDVPSGI